MSDKEELKKITQADLDDLVAAVVADHIKFGTVELALAAEEERKIREAANGALSTSSSCSSDAQDSGG